MDAVAYCQEQIVFLLWSGSCWPKSIFPEYIQLPQLFLAVVSLVIVHILNLGLITFQRSPLHFLKNILLVCPSLGLMSCFEFWLYVACSFFVNSGCDDWRNPFLYILFTNEFLWNETNYIFCQWTNHLNLSYDSRLTFFSVHTYSRTKWGNSIALHSWKV